MTALDDLIGALRAQLAEEACDRDADYTQVEVGHLEVLVRLAANAQDFALAARQSISAYNALGGDGPVMPGITNWTVEALQDFDALAGSLEKKNREE